MDKSYLLDGNLVLVPVIFICLFDLFVLVNGVDFALFSIVVHKLLARNVIGVAISSALLGSFFGCHIFRVFLF